MWPKRTEHDRATKSTVGVVFHALATLLLLLFAHPVLGGSFKATARMNYMRTWHTATLLPNGKALVAGGSDGSFGNSSAELYDYSKGTWTGTGTMATNRYYHTATLLNDGKVLVSGGMATSAWYSGPLDAAEVYDPATGTWTVTGRLVSPRYAHTATLLADGRVLVTGGVNGVDDLSSCELYDPLTGAWSQSGALSAARYHHTATRLPNGKVLVVGGTIGIPLASAEIYDPVAGTCSPTGSLAEARYAHTATLLGDGKVLVAAGEGASGRLASAELYDPVNGTWTLTGGLLNARRFHTATLMPDGKVLVAGSYSGGNALFADAEIYNPIAGRWSAEGNLVTDRFRHTATRLPDGTVLIAGGYAGYEQTSAELYTPDTVYSPMPLQCAAAGPGVVELSFTNSPGGWFEVIASSNPSVPLVNWTNVGGPALEASPGFYRFSVTNLTDATHQFYRARSL